jgi:hypothetical protein
MSAIPSPSTNLEELQELLIELDALETTYRTAKIAFYRPLRRANNQNFQEADASAVQVVLGSNRSGKSVDGAAKAISHAIGYRPWLPIDHTNRIVRLTNGLPIPVPNIGRVLAQNYEQAIKQTIWPKFQEWLPAEMIKRVSKNARGVPTEIELTNGSQIHFLSDEQEDMALEGSNGHWVWIDEPCGYKKYVALRRGLIDFGGHLWMTLTPLSQPWINEILVDRANEGDESLKLYRFSVWDNAKENGGYLERKDIEDFLKDLREDELEARLHGNFLHLAGRVYKQWEPMPPFWVPPFDIPRNWPRVCLIDPHPRKPIAVLWLAISPDDQVFAYRALFDGKLRTVRDVAKKILAFEKHDDWQEPIAMRVIDTSAQQNEPTSGLSIRLKFAECGVHTLLAKKRNAAAGYDAIHDALKCDKYEWSEPQLVVFNTCRPVKQNFLNFIHSEWQSSKARDLHGEREDYVKANDDFIDLLRYYFQSGMTYRTLVGLVRRQSQNDPEERANGRQIILPGTHSGYDRSTWNGRRTS